MTHQEPPPPRRDPGHAGRVYSSYTVRTWSRPGSTGYDRVEVHHLQTGEVVAAKSVTSEWIRQVIDQGQQEDADTGTGGTS